MQEQSTLPDLVRTVFVVFVNPAGPFYDGHENSPMESLGRLYTSIPQHHLDRHRQMAFVTGPRQVGKTTGCRSLAEAYLNWDNSEDRRALLRGSGAFFENSGPGQNGPWSGHR